MDRNSGMRQPQAHALAVLLNEPSYAIALEHAVYSSIVRLRPSACSGVVRNLSTIILSILKGYSKYTMFCQQLSKEDGWRAYSSHSHGAGHTCTVPSLLPEAMYMPSDDQATPCTQSVCPR